MKIFILNNFQITIGRVVDRGGDFKTNWFNTLLLDAQITPCENESERYFFEEVKHKLHSGSLPYDQRHQRVIPRPIMYYSLTSPTSDSEFRATLPPDTIRTERTIRTPSELGRVSGLPLCPPPGYIGPLQIRYIKTMPAFQTPPNLLRPAFLPPTELIKRARQVCAGGSGTEPVYVLHQNNGEDIDNPQIFLTMGLKQDGSMDFRLVGTLLEKLRLLYGDEFKMKLEVKKLKISKTYPGSEHFPEGNDATRADQLEFVTSFIVEDIKLKRDCMPIHNFSCFGAEVPLIFPLPMQDAWNSGWFLCSGTVTLEVIFLPLSDTLVKDRVKLNRKILNEEIGTDASIIAGNRKVIKCHKAFLCASSSVFANMFRAKMKNCETNQITLPNVSERAIKTLLSYIYCWDLEDPNKDISLSVELLQIAHQYAIKDLETAMQNLLLNRSNQFFRLEDALDLFCYTRKVSTPTYTDLSKKAVQVVKFHSNLLDRSMKYRELFVVDPDAARELCKLALLT